MLQSRLIPYLFIFIVLHLSGYTAVAQNSIINDSLSSNPNQSDSISKPIDSIAVVDSLLIQTKGDSTNKSKKESELDAPVDYSAKDSMIISIDNQMIYLYNGAHVKYTTIELDAGYIEFGMADKSLFAEGLTDSADVVNGAPIFKDKEETFDSEKLTYNFQTKKGVIRKVYMVQDGGYLHGDKIKRHENEHIHMKNGKYSTCDLKEPHFYLALTKAEVIPQDKIVSGPAYLVIEDIPIYFIGLPFGFFPNTKGSKSGVLIPDYGEEQQRGFFIKDGGYYFVLNKYVDLKLTGSLYSNGSWGTNVESRYTKRYKFNGNFVADYYKDIREVKSPIGLGLTKDTTTDIRIIWQHIQDARANPYSRFSANVNFSTTSFDKQQSYNYNNFTQNTKSSNISYTKSWPTKPFNFSANLMHNQSARTGEINFKLPNLSFDVARQNPFKGLSGGKDRWYEDIQVGYSASLENNINSHDTLIFTTRAFENVKNGFRHEIPVSFLLKPFRNFTISPNIVYEGVASTQWINEVPNDTNPRAFVVKEREGFIYGHSLRPSLSANYMPRIYGMYQFTNPNSKINAVRHVITPSLGASYTPDISEFMPNYNRSVFYNDSLLDEYSLFEQGIYTIQYPPGEGAAISMGLKNNLEMKVRMPTDTSVEYKKVSLLDRFDFNTSYDPFRDSLKFNPINVIGGTRLFNNLLDLQFTGILDPYAYVTDSNNYSKRINRAQYSVDKNLVRLTNFQTGFGFNLNNDTFRKKKKETAEGEENTEEEEEVEAKDNLYSYFMVPWNLGFDYKLTYQKLFNKSEIIQSVGINGGIDLTKTWKITMNTNYDFVMKKLTYTSARIYKDLHCWEMELNFAPFGDYKFFYFKINAKSTILGDLKYDKRKNWRDY